MLGSLTLKSIMVHDVEETESDEELLAWAAEYLLDTQIPVRSLSPLFSLKRQGNTAEIFIDVAIDTGENLALMNRYD